jgi:hypothetical protein
LRNRIIDPAIEIFTCRTREVQKKEEGLPKKRQKHLAEEFKDGW